MTDATEIPGFREFEFDLPEALLDQLIATFDRMAGARLVVEHLHNIPDAQGVYLLIFGNDIVYIGKTDAEAGLRRRLERHARVIRHRRNLDPEQIMFKAVRVFVFTAMDLETQLIKRYGSSWNNSGFGSNDPGRNRDSTELKAEGFDALYPIDIDRPINPDFKGTNTAADALKVLKTYLPYYLRFQGAAKKGKKPHPDLAGARIKLPKAPLTTRRTMEAVLRCIPSGWQATVLPGRIILYKEVEDYPAGTLIGRSS